MKPGRAFYWGLGAFFVIALLLWLGLLQGLAEWLWNLLHVLPHG
jgi:hypothetical protein